MKKGIYPYSTTLPLQLGQIGIAYIHLCSTTPTLYVDEPLYESKSKNGLNLHFYVKDKVSEYQNTSISFCYQTSYDEKLILIQSNIIEIEKANGTKETYQRKQVSHTFENIENQSYIQEIYSEETCTNHYTLYEGNQIEYQYKKHLSNNYYLNEIHFKNGKKIIIERNNDATIKSIQNEQTKERIEYEYKENSSTITLYRENTSTSKEKLYQYAMIIHQPQEFTLYHRVYTSEDTYRGYKTHRYTYTDENILIQETREYITHTYTFLKNSEKAILQYKDENNSQIIIQYGNHHAIVHHKRSGKNIQYGWDNKGRIMHIYNQKEQTFANINYDNENHPVIQSALLYQNKEINPNYIEQGKEMDYDGNINDVISAILEVTSLEEYSFKILIVFQKIDEDGNLLEEDRICPYEVQMENPAASTNLFVFSTFSNIQYNHIKIEVEDLQKEGHMHYIFMANRKWV